MFKSLFTAIAITVSASASAASKAATEAWVANYVSNQVAAVSATLKSSQENGKTTVAVEENGATLICTVEEPIIPAIVLADCSAEFLAMGFANGMVFAYAGNGEYRNMRNSIQATSTNLVLNHSYHSKELSGSAYFMNGSNKLGKAVMTNIQPTVANSIKGSAQ